MRATSAYTANPLSALKPAPRDPQQDVCVLQGVGRQVAVGGTPFGAGIDTLINHQTVKADRIGKFAERLPFGGAGAVESGKDGHGNQVDLVELCVIGVTRCWCSVLPSND